MRTTFLELLATAPIVADGGMGTMLFSAGMARGSAPELWNVERPDVVHDIHQAYIRAGAQIILTNTFGGNRLRLGMHRLESRLLLLHEAAVQLACTVAELAPRPVVVGGSMGPIGSLLEPNGNMTFDEAVSVFEEQAAALNGVDVFWIETMSDLNEVRAAVAGCRKANPNTPIATTMTFDTKGRTMMGVRPEEAVKTLIQFGVTALGANCGNGPAEIEQVIEKMHRTVSSVPLIAKANAGLPHIKDGLAVYDATPELMVDYARRVLKHGAHVVGACCGSTPDHIRAISDALQQVGSHLEQKEQT